MLYQLIVTLVFYLTTVSCNQNIEFRLYPFDAEVLGNYITITPENLGNFTYKSQLNYVFLLHDINDKNGFDGEFIPRSTQKFIKKNNYIVIAAGYGKFFEKGLDKATENIPLIGKAIGELMVAIARKDVNPQQFEVAGHGLGAHIAGVASHYVEKTTNEKVKKIYAVDPTAIDEETNRILKKTDAGYVQVIHTSNKGIQKPIGDVDFYPNGGLTHTQCQQYLPYDDHQMGIYYFVCSIIKDCRMYGTICENIEKYGAYECQGQPQAMMGYGTDNNVPKGTYYLYTFCREMQGKVLRY